MNSRTIKVNCRIIRMIALGLFVLMFPAAAAAQTSPIEGTVKVRAADGTVQPVPGAMIDIFRTDIKGHYEVKADKSGRFVRLGLPLIGRYIVVASGPGIEPSWVNNVRLTQTTTIDIVTNPGNGTRLTLEQVQEQIKRASAGGGQPSGGAPATSEGDRAKMETAKKEYEEKKKEAEVMQASFDQARTRYNQGLEFMKASNFSAALTEFEQVSQVDPGKHTAFAELAYRANANVAEAHYQLGVDLFNQRKRDEAKPHFQKAVAAANKAIGIASSGATPGAATDLVVYHNIYAKNAMLLVEYYGATDLLDEAIKVFDKGAELDPNNKNKWLILKGNLYRLSSMTPEAVASYKTVLAADPDNLDAIYNMGLTLLASTEKEQLQEAANALAEFVAKAPAEDKRVPDARSSLEVLKNEFKVEADKPQRQPARRRGRP